MTVRPAPSRREVMRGAGALAAFAAGGATLASCSTTRGRTPIRFFEFKRETIEYFQRLTDDFNASQDQYDVTLEQSTNLVADFIRNSPVQVGATNFKYEFSGFITRGVLSDLTDSPILETLRPDFVEYTQQFGTYNDEISCLPYSLAAGGVIYNRDIFDQAGVSIPRTWTEFKMVCETLLSKKITPILGTWFDSWTLSQGIIDFMIGGSLPSVNDFFHDLRAQGTDVGPSSPVSFSEDWLAPMLQIRELDPYFNDDRRNVGYDQGNREFANGKAAMMFQGPWAYTGIGSANPDFRGGMFPLPCTEDPEDTKAWLTLDLVLFNPRSGSPEQLAGGTAMTEFLMQPDVLHTYNQENLAFSPDKDAPAQTDERVSDMDPYVKDGRYYQSPCYYMPFAIPIDRYVQEYMFGGSAEQFVSNLDRDWKRLAIRLSA